MSDHDLSPAAAEHRTWMRETLIELEDIVRTLRTVKLTKAERFMLIDEAVDCAKSLRKFWRWEGTRSSVERMLGELRAEVPRDAT